MKTGKKRPVKQTGGGGSTPVGGVGFGPIGGVGFGPIGGVGFGPIGGGPGASDILERISEHLGQLSKAFGELAKTPIGGVPGERAIVSKTKGKEMSMPIVSAPGARTMTMDFNPQVPFMEEDQQADELCWIAVAVSVKHHFDKASAIQQCGLVKDVLGISGPCCTDSGGVRENCDQPGRLEDALGHPSVDHLAADTAAHPNPKGGGAMTFAEIQAQIDLNLPVGVFIQWPGKKVGHFILISGYHEAGGNQYVYVNDPLFGGGPQPYNRVVSNYNLEHGTWQFTYRLKG